MSRLPAIFLSHGAPDLPIQSGAAQDFLRTLSHTLPQPEAILVISAHWISPQPRVSAAPNPQTIHDFSGFPDALYQLTYPTPGAPGLAKRVVELLAQAELPGEIHPTRGLDHGAWTPLLLAYPEADIPVTQLSIQYPLGPAHHLALGRALEPLRDEGILILASGAATHNLWERTTAYAASPPTWVMQFDQWLSETTLRNDVQSLLNYRQLAPHAVNNHPTDEHLLPFFVALGAGGENVQATQLHRSYTYGVLSMAAFAFA